MKMNLGKTAKSVLLFGLLLSFTWTVESKAQTDQWNDPFENISGSTENMIDSLTLNNVLRLVGKSHPSLLANRKRIMAAEILINQAGLSPNPELQVEVEEVSGNAAGFNESELNIALSQELELWGKRGARKRLARAESESIRFKAKFESFDLYASVIERFSRVEHAQNRVTLSSEAARIAESIAETAKQRVDKGASLPSEYILGQLQFERARLRLDQAKSDLTVEKIRLSSLWNDSTYNYNVKQSGVELDALDKIIVLEELVEGGRRVSSVEKEERIVNARLNLEESNGKPNVTLIAGLKRFQADDANTFIIGVELPLPFFNRNQGSTASLRESVEALKLDRQQAMTESKTILNSARREVSELSSRYHSLSNSLLPKAEETYSSLKKAYDSGRIPYSILLESQRTLIDIRFELNDLMLTINQQLITLERLYGVQLH